MTKLIISALFTLSLFAPMSYATEPETKQVCVDKVGKDGKPLLGKDGKPQQECKNIKVHKKLEGTKVPDKK